jgi:hypothetical protein
LVTYLLAIAPIIWSFAYHQFIGNDSDRVVVDWKGVVLSAHHFRGHVPWSAARICVVVGLNNSSDTEISDSEVSFVVKHQIFWFDIAVYDIVEVEKLQSDQHAGNEEFGFAFLEPASAAHMVPEIPSHEQVHDEIEVFPVLEGVGHVDDEGVFEFAE